MEKQNMLLGLVDKLKLDERIQFGNYKLKTKIIKASNIQLMKQYIFLSEPNHCRNKAVMGSINKN